MTPQSIAWSIPHHLRIVFSREKRKEETRKTSNSPSLPSKKKHTRNKNPTPPPLPHVSVLSRGLGWSVYVTPQGERRHQIYIIVRGCFLTTPHKLEQLSIISDMYQGRSEKMGNDPDLIVLIFTPVASSRFLPVFFTTS